MNKMFPVLKREYMTRVKTKGFIIGTIALPLFMVFIIAVPVFLALFKSEKPCQLVVLDLSQQVYPLLISALDDTTTSGARLYQLSLWEVTPGNLSIAKTELAKKVDKKEIDGYILIPTDVFQKNYAEFYAKNVSNFEQNRTIERAISSVITRIRLERTGLDPIQISQMVRTVNLKTFKVRAGKEEEDTGFTFGITYVLAMILYIALLLYGVMVMRSVIEEKNSRVVELVVSSVKPSHLMAGKILGVGAVGLTQIFIWVSILAFLSFYAGSLVTSIFSVPAAEIKLPSIPVSVLIYFVVFFVLGYFFFSTWYAGLGAMVNSEQEAQSLQMPLIMFLVIPVLMMVYVIGNPDSTLSIVLSLIPVFSPIVMFMRISVQMPPFYEILASIVFLILSIAAMIWLVGKIYRVGILMYGKRPNLPELIKWIKYG